MQQHIASRNFNRTSTPFFIRARIFRFFSATCLAALSAGTFHGQQPAAAFETGSGLHSASPDMRATLSAPQKREIKDGYFRQNLRFEPNQGQTDPSVQFLSRGDGYSLYLRSSDAVLSILSKKGKAATLEMQTVGGNAHATGTAVKRLSSNSNYLIGSNAANWHRDVPNFAKVEYRAIYPGIDVTYYGSNGRLEYDFAVAPGADPGAVRLRFSGMKNLYLDKNGALTIDTAAGPVRLEHPVLYQQAADGHRDAVQGAFTVARNEVSFKVGAYDKRRPLVIDPVLAYSTYLGQEDYSISSGLFVSAIAADAAGNVYVTGITNSTTFPVLDTGLAITPPVSPDLSYVFVTKFSPDGALSYSTILGGSLGSNLSGGIAIDDTGSAYVAGYTYATDFPVTPNAVQSHFNQAEQFQTTGFVVKLNSNGSNFDYSTFLGGSTDSRAIAIAADNAGHAYLTGWDEGHFPTTAGAYQKDIPAAAAHHSPYVAKLAPNGQSLMYATYVGGEQTDTPAAVAIDTAGDAYITGAADSVHFPTVNAFQTTQAGAENAFVSKLNPLGTDLLYSTYLGGSVKDSAYGIAVDADGEAFVTGLTTSPNFPLENPYQDTFDAADAFVTRLDAAGSHLLYSTYLGGSLASRGTGISLDSAGNAFVVGETSSTAVTAATPRIFPTLNGLPFSSPSGQVAAFATRFDLSDSVTYSTLFGGNTDITHGTGIAVDSSGSAYIAGVTSASDIPTTVNAYQPALKGTSDVFVAKLWPIAISPNQTSFFFPDTQADSTSPLTLTLTNSGLTKFEFSGLTVDGIDASAFSQTNTCGSAILPNTSCTITLSFTPQVNRIYNGNVSFDLTDNVGVTQMFYRHLTGHGIGGPLAVLSPSLLSFNNLEQTLIFALDNPGTRPLAITSITVTGKDPSIFMQINDCGTSLPANSSCEIKVRYRPRSAPPAGGYYTAFITVNDNVPGSPQLSEVTGPAPSLAFNPGVFTFPDTTVGTTAAAFPVKLTNTGRIPLLISNIAIVGGNAGDFSQGNDCPASLVPNDFCTVTINFDPASVGHKSASVSVTDNAVVSPSLVNFSGTAVAPNPVFSTTSINFPNTVVNSTSAVQQIHLANIGTAPLQIQSIRIGSAGLPGLLDRESFSLVGNDCPASLPIDAYCTLTLTFNPIEAAVLSAPFYFEDNAPGSTQVLTLNGTGAVPTAALSPLTINFPSVPAGLTSTAPIYLENTGIVPLTITNYSFNGPGTSSFTIYKNACPTTLAAGTSCLITLEFKPTYAAPLNATFRVLDNAATPGQSATLLGTATPAVPILKIVTPLNSTPPDLEFADTPVGYNTSPQVVRLYNVGSAALTGLSIHLGDTLNYHITGNTCGATIAINQSCQMAITFKPTALAGDDTSLTITDNAAGSPQKVLIYGSSAVDKPAVAIHPPGAYCTSATDECFFPNTQIGSKSIGMAITLTSDGNVPLKIGSMYIDFHGIDPGSFQLANYCPSILDVGKSCTVTVYFTPHSPVKYQVQLNIYDDDQLSKGLQTIGFTGFGIQ